MKLAPMTVNIGSEVDGVDLGKLDDATFAGIEEALVDRKVLVFRDQDIDAGDLVEFGLRFGDLDISPATDHLPDHPEVAVLDNGPDKPPYVDYWHMDTSYRECPPLGSILRAVDIPPVGGDTLWANMESAYRDLDDDVKARVDGLRAVHSLADNLRRQKRRSAEDVARAEREVPAREHPVIRRHPVTGNPCVNVYSQVSHIVGVDAEENARLMQVLTASALRPEYQCRLRWRAGTVAMWDNRCTQHYGVADYAPHHRRMERVTVVGDRPV